MTREQAAKVARDLVYSLGASARRVAMDLKLEGPELRWLLAERTTRAS